MGGTDFRWFEFGNSQRFHMQAGDISRTHVEKRTHFALLGTAISTPCWRTCAPAASPSPT